MARWKIEAHGDDTPTTVQRQGLGSGDPSDNVHARAWQATADARSMGEGGQVTVWTSDRNEQTGGRS